MEKRFHFLRFVSVLLRILACLLLIAGIVAIILGFTSGGGSEGLLSQSLHWVARIAGVIAFLVGLGYFIVFWGVAEVVRILLTIEQSSRSGVPSAQSAAESVSPSEIADVVSARLDQLWGSRLTASKPAESPVMEVEPEPVVVEVPATVTAVPVPPVVLPPLETAAPVSVDEIVVGAPVAETIEDLDEIEDLAAEVIESDIAGDIGGHIAMNVEEVIAEAPPVDVAMVVDAGLPSPEILDELAEEVSFAQDVEEIVAEAPELVEEAEAAIEDIEAIAAEADEMVEVTVAAADDLGEDAVEVAEAAVESVVDAQEEVEEAETEVEELAAEIEPEAVAEAIEETEDGLRQKAKAALDRSLEQAARQMAELESPVLTPVAPPAPQAAEDNLADIVGIGPVFKVRLRQAGIASFADLAAASSEQLAELTEQSVERIENEDWIGQAEERLAVG